MVVSHAVPAVGLLTRGSSWVTEWHLDDVETLAAVLPLHDDRRLAVGVLSVVTLLACFLAETRRWTGSRDQLVDVLETLGALRSRFVVECSQGAARH